jgi:hypothetical protein
MFEGFETDETEVQSVDGFEVAEDSEEMCTSPDCASAWVEHERAETCPSA